MNGYDSDNDSHVGDPVLLGLTGDACATCKSTDVPLYDLSCHDSDDFHCRDCLTKTWYNANDEVIRCPACGNDCDFMPLKTVEDFRISRNFHDVEAIDKIRTQPEIMNNLIGFTARESIVFLQHVYSLVEDQILNPVELGGLPSNLTQNVENSAGESFARNPFYCGLIVEVTAVPKMMTAPLQLEEDLLKLLDGLILNYMKLKHGDQLAASGIDLNNDEFVLHLATTSDQYVKDVRDNWITIIKMWVELLAWRHIERTAPAEGGAADRCRAPITL